MKYIILLCFAFVQAPGLKIDNIAAVDHALECNEGDYAEYPSMWFASYRRNLVDFVLNYLYNLLARLEKLLAHHDLKMGLIEASEFHEHDMHLQYDLSQKSAEVRDVIEKMLSVGLSLEKRMYLIKNKKNEVVGFGWNLRSSEKIGSIKINVADFAEANYFKLGNVCSVNLKNVMYEIAKTYEENNPDDLYKIIKGGEIFSGKFFIGRNDYGFYVVNLGS